MLRNKARLNWAKEGDRNSKYFHAIIRDWRKKQVTQLALDSGAITTDPTYIGMKAVNYYTELFSTSPYHLDFGLFEHITPCISEADDQNFSRWPTMEELMLGSNSTT